MHEAEELFENLMFFLTMLGSELPKVLRDVSRIRGLMDDPRGRIWVQRAMAMGIIVVRDDEVMVDWDRLGEIRKKVREAFEECLGSLGYS